jgi:hypothetical protein
MKLFSTVLLCLVGLMSHQNAKSQEVNYYKNILGRYVHDGLVNYKALKADSLISPTADYYASFDYSSLSKNEQKAHLINAYNFSTIKLICANYPISSPMEIAGFFKSIQHEIAGKKITLDHLENKILRVGFSDPRLHFSLVCGALGCPRLSKAVYLGANLDAHLKARTKHALNSDWFVYEKDGIIHLSEIFTWYQEDFGKSKADVIKYINEYRTSPFSDTLKTKNYNYDWTINNGVKDIQDFITSMPKASGNGIPFETYNVQTFNAGSLLGKGQMDFTLFNSLYTETKSNWQGVDYSGFRSSFATSLIQVTAGASKNNRINVGFDLNIRSNGRAPADSSASAINRIFKFSNTDTTRFGLASAGIRIKVQPFKTVSNFTIQSTLLAPTIKAPEGNDSLSWADWDRITWWNQLYYTETFGKFQLFGELDFLFRFQTNKSQIAMLDLPMNLFVSYFPTSKITVYVMTQHVHRLTNNIEPQIPIITDWVIPASYTSSGIGFKYQLSNRLNLELLYTNFWRSKNAGLGNTFNLGIKYITKR